mmetsp:Transcript_174387/g.559039  ORF Transcript_174387/g.559039 Transcript_174387/m.559039 type:complete len:83 (+) Transcript_174387:155-403(+)
MSDVITGCFLFFLLVAALIFAGLFTRCPGLRKALLDFVIDVLGDDGEDEKKKEEESDDDDADKRLDRKARKRGGGGGGNRRR